MSTAVETEAYERLRQTIDRLMKGERNAEEVLKPCEEMDAAREQLRQRIGTVEVAVDLIRDARQ